MGQGRHARRLRRAPDAARAAPPAQRRRFALYVYERRNGVNRFMMRRPLALFAMLYGCGALAGYYGAIPLRIWAALAALCLAGRIASRKRVLVFALALMLGGLVTCWSAIIPPAAPTEDTVIAGRVAAEPQWDGDRAAVVLSEVTIGGKPHPRDVRCYLYGAPVEARIGDELSFPGGTFLPQGRRNPHGIDFRAWLWTRGSVLCASGQAESAVVAKPTRLSFASALGATRALLARRIDALFPEQAPLVRALVLGDRTALDEGLQDDFRQAGLAHLLAISGLHVSCLALALERLLRALRCSRRAAIWTTLALLLVYAALIGFPASVVRAALMFLCARGALLTGRPPDALTGLSAAFLVLLCIRPLSIADAGFQLSFGAVLGMLLLNEPLSALLHRPHGLVWPGIRDGKKALNYLLAEATSLLIASLAAQSIALPVLAQTFGAVTPFAPLVNILAIPLTTAMLPLAMLKLLLGAGGFLLPDVMLDLLTRLAAWAARMPGSAVALPAWPHYLVAIYLAVCFAASPYVRISVRWRKLLLCALPVLAALSLPIAWLTLPAGLNLAFLDAGQADACVIRAEGQIYAVDLGKDGGPAVDYLVRTGQRPRAVFLTHPHADHCGGLGGLLKAMRPDVIYIPECWDRTEAEGDVNEQLDKARAMGVRVKKLMAGDSVHLSEQVTVDVLQPASGDAPSSGNGGSMVLQVRYGEGSALLTGDLPTVDELAGYPDVDVLKAAHHGSGTSNSELLFRAASPSALVISVGRNGYGHPAGRVLDMAERLQIPIYRTDESGAVFAQIQPSGEVHMTKFLEDAA